MKRHSNNSLDRKLEELVRQKAKSEGTSLYRSVQEVIANNQWSEKYKYQRNDLPRVNAPTEYEMRRKGKQSGIADTIAHDDWE